MAIRQNFFIDAAVQGALLGRVALYSGVALAYVCLGALSGQYHAEPTLSFGEHLNTLFTLFWPWLPGLLLLPLVALDVVRLSNRFAGPVYRLSRHLRSLDEDHSCTPLSFRDGDYWQHLAPSINRLQLTILQLEAELALFRASESMGAGRLQAAKSPSSENVANATDLNIQGDEPGKASPEKVSITPQATKPTQKADSAAVHDATATTQSGMRLASEPDQAAQTEIESSAEESAEAENEKVAVAT